MIWRCSASRKRRIAPTPQSDRARAVRGRVRDRAVDQDGARKEAERLDRVEARELREIERLRLEAEEHRRDPSRGAAGDGSHPHEEHSDERRAGDHGRDARNSEAFAEHTEERGHEIRERAGARIRLSARSELEGAARNQRMRGHDVVELIHVRRVVQANEPSNQRDREHGDRRDYRGRALGRRCRGVRGAHGHNLVSKRRRPRGKSRAFRRTFGPAGSIRSSVSAPGG